MTDEIGAMDDAGAGPADLVEARRSFAAALDEPAAGERSDDAGRSRQSDHDGDRSSPAPAPTYVPSAGPDPDIADGLGALAQLFDQDPEQAATIYAEIFGIGDAPATADEARQEVREMFAIAQAQQAQHVAHERAVEQARGSVRSTAQGLGFEPDSAEYRNLLQLAFDRYPGRPVAEALPAAARELRKSGDSKKAGGDDWYDDSAPLRSAGREFKAALDRILAEG